MATTITKTVKASGGDYTSLSAWEAGEQGDLVTADELRQAECYGFQDTSVCAIDGSTTDATRYLRVFAAAGAEAQLPFDTSGTAYRLTPAAHAITMSDDYTRIERIQVHPTGNNYAILVGAPGGRLVGCNLAGGGGGGGGGFFVNVSLGAGTFTVINCVGRNTGGGNAYTFRIGATGTVVFYNCTAYAPANSARGFVQDAGTVICTNCLSITGTGAAFSGTFTDSDYNASSDTSAPGAASLLSIADPFVDAATFDFHLGSGAGPIGAGTDLSGTFTDDFDGDTRSGSWDIGADEVVSSVTLTVQDGAIGLAAEAPSLTQANVLAVQDAAAALGAESPALTQANTLAIQDALIALAAEQPTLSVGGITLTVQDGAIALAAETPALTQANVLVVAEAAVALAAESPSLTQAHILAVADAAIALAAENPGLTQAHVLAVQDGAIALTVDPVTLSLAALLEVADAAIALVSDGVALTQANQLAVADALISLAADNPALIQAHILSVHDAAIALVADNVVLVVPLGLIPVRTLRPAGRGNLEPAGRGNLEPAGRGNLEPVP
jgi:hypothetical protein